MERAMGAIGHPEDASPKNAEKDFPITPKSMAFHSLLILSDSALPLGSFAFSSGLESRLAHLPRTQRSKGLAEFKQFLEMSLLSVAGATLPFVQAAHSQPSRMPALDNDLDASTPCSVAKRASTAQGRALLSMWDRSLKANVTPLTDHTRAACHAIQHFSSLVKADSITSSEDDSSATLPFRPHGHLPPLFGVLGAAMSLDLKDTLYLFLLNHAKTLLSAGIRASVLGPYQSQGLLVSEWLRALVQSRVDDAIAHPVDVEDAGQCVPVLDIWGGRHEIIYSRIFNS